MLYNAWEIFNEAFGWRPPSTGYSVGARGQLKAPHAHTELAAQPNKRCRALRSERITRTLANAYLNLISTYFIVYLSPSAATSFSSTSHYIAG